MRKLPAERRRAVVLPASLAAMIPALVLFSRHAHSPVNDALVGLGAGLLVGVSAMSLILMRRRRTGNRPSLPK